VTIFAEKTATHGCQQCREQDELSFEGASRVTIRIAVSGRGREWERTSVKSGQERVSRGGKAEDWEVRKESRGEGVRKESRGE
jgi:hypothetical protein|tara:strand:- start:793 stop:1041 length:249 start_codon:yes stop_codon:yes gene_type:complete